LSACVQAFTKNDMKPSFTPCFFSNPSLYFLRRSMTAVMSTSLKVVSMAAVFCASFRRLAMRLAQARHAHAFLAFAGRARGLCGRNVAALYRMRINRLGRRYFGGALATFQVRNDITLGHPPILARPFNSGCIDIIICRHLAHGRAIAIIMSRRSRSSRRSRRLRGFGRRRRCCLGIVSRAAFAYFAQDRTHFNILTGLDRDLGNHTRGRGIDLQRHLVRFQLNNRLIGGDDIAFLFQPLGHSGFGYGFT
jgi:hypothetical protein